MLGGRNGEAKRQLADQAAAQFRYCIDKAIRAEVDWIFHSGDVFNRSSPPDWAMSQYYDIIGKALNHGIRVAVIPGNHDRGRIQPSLFDYEYPNYHVFNHIQQLEFEEFNLIGSPFIKNNYRSVEEKIQQWIDSSDKPIIILLHQLFAGAWFGPQQHIFTTQEDCIRLSLPDYSQVITGHIHRAQQLDHGKITYTGSTVRTSFAEIIESKGCLLGEVCDRYLSLKFVPIPTMRMKVLEYSGKKLNAKDLDLQLEQVPREGRVLLRLTDVKLPETQLQWLYARYPAERWPYLSISPQRGSINRPLYSRYKRDFVFDPVYRRFRNKGSSKNNHLNDISHSTFAQRDVLQG